MLTFRPGADHCDCLSHPPKIKQSLSNSAALPSNLRPWSVTVIFGRCFAAPGAHRSRSIVRSGILHFLHLIVRHPSMLRSIELASWKIENRSTTMRTIGGSPERIINYFVTFSAMPFNQCAFREFRFPARRLSPFVFVGGTLDRCACRQRIA